MHEILTNANLGKLLLEHVPAAVALFDDQMCCLDCSRRWRIDHGLEDQDVIGKSLGEVFPGIARQWREVHRRALAGEMVSGRTETSHRADGAADWVEWKIVPWRDEAGRIGGVAMFAEVITDLMESRRRAVMICPLLSGPKSLLFWTTKEFGNGQETQAGGDHRQAA